MAKLDSSLGLNDTMPFGKKHKGKTIEAIYKEDVSFLLWMRDTRKKENGDTKFFANEVHVLLDETVRSDKKLAGKFESWGHTMLPEGPVTATEPAKNEKAEFAYAEQWGAF